MITYLGWESNFYLNGIVTLSFGAIWCFLVFDTPEENSQVATEELIYISSNIIQNEDNDAFKSVKKFPPYFAILKSIKVWALVR